MGEGRLKETINPPGDFTLEEFQSPDDNPNHLRLVNEEPVLKDAIKEPLLGKVGGYRVDTTGKATSRYLSTQWVTLKELIFWGVLR